MAKIQTITVSNLKAVSELSIDFKGCSCILVGGNNRGKSTFLRSLPDRIRGIKPDVVLKHNEKEGFAELQLTTGEKFKWEFKDDNGKIKEKLTYITDRNFKSSVTKGIQETFFPKTFDVDEFLQLGPKKQTEILKKVSGLNFTELDNAYQEAYENRTFYNKKLQEEQVKSEYYDRNLQSELIDTTELEQSIYDIKYHNEHYQAIYDNNAAKIKESEALREQIKVLNERLKSVELDIFKNNNWMAVKKNQPISEESKKLKEKELSDVKELNKEIEKNNKAKEQAKELEKAEKWAKDADKEVKRIERDKLEAIRTSNLPEGFGFNDDGITYKGLSFTREQLSSSGIYIAALKLASLTLGEVKTLHFDASFLDKNSLLEIEQWANENDLQLLIERPDYDGGQITYELIS